MKYTVEADNIYEVTYHECWEIEADSEEEALQNYAQGICIDSTEESCYRTQEVRSEIIEVEE